MALLSIQICFASIFDSSAVKSVLFSFFKVITALFGTPLWMLVQANCMLLDGLQICRGRPFPRERLDDERFDQWILSNPSLLRFPMASRLHKTLHVRLFSPKKKGDSRSPKTKIKCQNLLILPFLLALDATIRFYKGIQRQNSICMR